MKVHFLDRISDELADEGEILPSRTANDDLVAFRIYNANSLLLMMHKAMTGKKYIRRGYKTRLIKDALLYYMHHKCPEIVPKRFKYEAEHSYKLNSSENE